MIRPPRDRRHRVRPCVARAVLVAAVALCALGAPRAAETGRPVLTADAPEIGVVGLTSPIDVAAEGVAEPAGRRIELRAEDGTVLGSATLDESGKARIEFVPRHGGTRDYTVALADDAGSAIGRSFRAIPRWMALLPPLLAIVVALAFRQVVPSLLAGVWAGATIVWGGPLIGLLRTVDRYVVQSLADTDHVAIVVFSLLLGGMVGVISRSGGTVGFVDSLTPLATSSRRGQLVTWLLGTVIFFDDYANTLIVGNTMRGVTDRLRISREKLAYIVDSTAAPVASLALISTWIGYEVSLIGDALRGIGSDQDAYVVFIRSIALRFYPVFALVFGFMVAVMMRDFGPMLRAERRAAEGKLMADGAVPLADFDSDALQPDEGKPRRWINAALPVLTVLAVTFVGLWLTGRGSLEAEGTEIAGGLRGIGTVFGAGDSYKSLLWASFAGCTVAIVMAMLQRLLTLADALAAWVGGVRSMTLAIIILVLAWSIAAVCGDLRTDDVMVEMLSGAFDPRLLPTMVFVAAAATAFATGTSWGTMGIIVPLAVPAAHGMAVSAGLDPAAADRVLLGAVSAVLAGAIFGDHCSPISDTTVMSSMSSGCDHVDHVRTQLPYALVAAFVAIVFGTLPAGFGAPAWLCMLGGSAILWAMLRLLGRNPRAGAESGPP